MYNNELYNNNVYNGKQLDNKCKGKKELYNFYVMMIFTISNEIVLSKNVCDDGKRARLYRLIYKENELEMSSSRNPLLGKSINTSHPNNESYSVNADESLAII